MLKLGHSQVRNRDEVGGSFKTSGCTFGLLEQSIHGLDISVTAVVQHTAHHAIEALLQSGCEFFEWLQTATSCPTQPALASASLLCLSALAYTVRSAIFKR